MIYQDTGELFSLGEDVTDLVFLASLPPTPFLVACHLTARMPRGHMRTALGTARALHVQQQETHSRA